MRSHLHRIPSVPHADWFTPSARVDHMRSLVEFRLGKKLRTNPVRTYLSPNDRQLPANSSQSPDGMFVSLKCLEAQYWEARHEQFAFWVLEANSSVVHYRHQPHTLNIHTGGQHLRYLPDVEYHLDNGQKVILETKYDYADATGDVSYMSKLVLAAEAYKQLGYHFEIWTEVEDLQQSHRLRNARRMIKARFDLFSTEDELRLNDHFVGRDGWSTVGQLSRDLIVTPCEHPAISERKVFRAAIMRRVGINIFTASIGPSTPVRLLSTPRAPL